MQYTNLWKKTIGYYITFLILTPFWFLTLSKDRKTWQEFKIGWIPHKCKFWERRADWYGACKHHGCNMVTDYDLDDFLKRH